MKQKQQKWLMYGFWIWALIIMGMAVYPDIHQTVNQADADETLINRGYLQHFLSFMILSVLFYFSGQDANARVKASLVWIYVLAAVFFSWITEAIQVAVPGRSYNNVDTLYNLLGLLSGLIAAYALGWLQQRMAKNMRK